MVPGNLQCSASLPKCFSTVDNLFILETEIRDAFVDGQQVFAIFFDLKKAYYTAWRFLILKKFRDCGINGKIFQFIRNFLSNRTFKVSVNGLLSIIRPIDTGTSQESVLSTTLFNLAINDIVNGINLLVKSLLYVNDVTLYIKVRNLSSMYTCTGFTFLRKKTKGVRFSKVSTSPIPSLTLHGQTMTFVP